MDKNKTVKYYDKYSDETFNIPIYNVEPYELKEKHNRSVYKAIYVSINLLADRLRLKYNAMFSNKRCYL